MHITPFGISGIAEAIFYSFLCYIFWTKGKNLVAKVYAIENFFIFLWGIGAFIIGSTNSKEVASLIWIFSYTAVLFIPTTYLHTCYLIINKKVDLYLISAYFLSFYFSFLTINGQLITEITFLFNSIYYFKGKSWFICSFIFWIITISFGNLLLILNFDKCSPNQKSDIKIMFWGTPMGFMAGISNFLPAFNLDIYPYGNFLIPIYSLVVTYSVFKNHLFDTGLIIKKSLVYSIFIVFLLLFYLLFAFILEKYAQDLLGYKSYALSLFTAFAVGGCLIPLYKTIQNIIDRYFFKGTTPEIAEQNELLRREAAQKEKYKLLSTLASGIAHEIRNPITALKTFHEFFPQKQNDPEFVAKFNAIGQKEIGRIEELLKQLLEFSRPTPPQLKPTNAHKLLDETLDLLGHQIKNNKVELVKNYVQADVTLALDNNQIKQAFLNILQNAIEAMAQGGTLTVTTDICKENNSNGQTNNVKTPSPQPLFTSNFLTITFTDTGPGIPPDIIAHIFEPFYTSKSSGTGLGLAITKTIIEEHGGKISVKSTVGQGTEFKIELPVK